MSDGEGDDSSYFSKEYEGMWFLLCIPGIMIVGTVVVAIIYKLVPKKKKIQPEQDPQSDEVAPKNVDLEEIGIGHAKNPHHHRFEAQIHKDIDTEEN